MSNSLRTYEHRRKRADVRAAAEPRSARVRAVDRCHAHALGVLGVVVELRRGALPLGVELLAERTPRRVVVDEHELVLAHEVVKRRGRERRRVVHAAADRAVGAAPDWDALRVVVHHDFVQARDVASRSVRRELEVPHVARDVDKRLAHVVRHVDARERTGHSEETDVKVNAQAVLLVLIERHERLGALRPVRVVVRVHERDHEHERKEREEPTACAADLELFRHFAASHACIDRCMSAQCDRERARA